MKHCKKLLRKKGGYIGGYGKGSEKQCEKCCPNVVKSAQKRVLKDNLYECDIIRVCPILKREKEIIVFLLS